MDKVYQRLTKQDITSFFTFIGYFCLPEFYITLARDPKLWDGNFAITIFFLTVMKENFAFTKQKLLSKADKALQSLQKFSAFFQFAKPRTEMWRAVISYVSGKQLKGEGEWRQAIDEAKNGSMLYEEAFIYQTRGVVAERAADAFSAVKLIPELRPKLIPMPELVIKRRAKSSSSLRLSSVSSTL